MQKPSKCIKKYLPKIDLKFDCICYRFLTIKLSPRSYFSAKVDPRITFVSQNWPQNHVCQPKFSPKSCFSAKIEPKIIFVRQNRAIHPCIACKYMCNKQTCYSGIQCLVSPRLILDTTQRENNSTNGGGAEGAAPIGTVVARAQRAPPLCGVQNQPWAH